MTSVERTCFLLSLFFCLLAATAASGQNDGAAVPGSAVQTVKPIPSAVQPERATLQSGVTEPELVQRGGQSSPEVLIGSGDLLEVSVYGAQDFNKQVRVSSTGDITLPLIGTVHVAELSTTAAQELVASRLKQGGFFNDPQVSILEREYSNQGVSVLGEVQKPGVYTLLGSRTLFDAISAGGGLTTKASSRVRIIHRNGRPPQLVTLGTGSDTSQAGSVQIRPGDTVVVEKAGIIYVVGDVRQPSGFVMENSELTVLQAVAMAQGANPTAALNNASIIRRSATGDKQQIPVQLGNILTAKAEDVRLQPDDIVFVPISAAKSAGRRTVEAIIQVATGVAIYGARR